MEILDRIDWASVNWLYVAVLTTLVFFSTLIGALLSFKRTFRTAVLSSLLFVAAFVFWTYYPHGLPLPTSVTAQKAPDSLAPMNDSLLPNELSSAYFSSAAAGSFSGCERQNGRRQSPFADPNRYHADFIAKCYRWVVLVAFYRPTNAFAYARTQICSHRIGSADSIRACG